MSQQEFERENQEAMDLANRKWKCAGRIATSPAAPRNDRYAMKVAPCSHSRAEQVRQMLWTAIQILSCILAAVLFIAALMDPGFVVFLANAGILICGMAAAVLTDRLVSRRRSS